MDVFDYLKDDNARIAQHLTDTAENYSQWTRDRIFEETKKMFASTNDHFSRDTILENNLKNKDGIDQIIHEAAKKRESISSDIEHIVEIHVDEPGFEQSLESIAQKYRDYAQYCESSFYPAIKRNLSAADLKRVNDQIEQKILS